jgi:hypothetical protein
MTTLDQDILANAADLTADDHLAAETVKDTSGGDTDPPAVDQDPNYVPPSVVDANGLRR